MDANFIQVLDSKLDAHTKSVQKEVQENAAELQKEAAQLKKQVEDLIKENTEKGAKLIQISEEIKEIQAEKGRLMEKQHKGQSLMGKLKEAIVNNADRFANAEKSRFETLDLKHWGPDMGKDVGAIVSGNLSGDAYHSILDWRPGMEPMGQIRFRDLVRVIPSAKDFVQFPRANTPVGEGSFGRQTTETADKAQVDRDFTMIDVNLYPMAGFAITSRASLRNLPFLQEHLPTSMLEQLLDAEDAQFSNLLVAAATGSSTTSGVTATPERLVRFAVNLYKAKHNVTGYAVDPDIWGSLMNYRPGTDNNYGLPNVVSLDLSGNIRIIGRPVFPVNWLTGGRIIAGDWTKTAIVQSEGLVLRQSDSHDGIFIKNQIAFLLERTEGLAIFRPEAFITTTLS